MCFFCLAIPIYALYFFISITANMLDLVEKIKCEIIGQVCFICIDQNNLTDNKKTKKHTKQYYKKVTNLFKRLQVNKQTSKLCEILKYVHIQYMQTWEEWDKKSGQISRQNSARSLLRVTKTFWGTACNRPTMEKRTFQRNY